MSKEQFLAENLKSGEIYAGLILGQGRTPDHHVFLQYKESKPLAWSTGVRWAKRKNGCMPTLKELALLEANLPGRFGDHDYWSSTPAARSETIAWLHNFHSGRQQTVAMSYSDTARALVVRRVFLNTSQGLSRKPFLTAMAQKGETYAGIMLGLKGEPDYHLFLQPGTATGATFNMSQTWAQARGGALPSAREQQLLVANLSSLLTDEWYWGSEQATGSETAGAYGSTCNAQQEQSTLLLGSARSVRRVFI